MNYPDTNNDGIPDAFENRQSITEILNAPPGALPCDATDTVIVEMETVARCPKKGEIHISPGGEISRATIDYGKYGNFKAFIIRRIVSGQFRSIKEQ